jgi:hypothetical protein
LETFDMMTLTKGMIGLSALITAAGVVGAISLSPARPQPTPASIVADRFVFAAESHGPAGEGVDLTEARRDAAALAAITTDAVAWKGDRTNVRAKTSCGDQTWPNLTSDCLVTADGALARRPVRYVTFEHRTGPSSSGATRVPLTDVASR